MNKDDTVYLGHMFDEERKVVGKVLGKSGVEFDADEDFLSLVNLLSNLVSLDLNP